MKKAYLLILLLLGIAMAFALQIGLKGERYATEGMEYYHRGEYNMAIQRFLEADRAASGSVPYYFYWLGRLNIAIQDTTQALNWLDRYTQSEDQEFRKQVDDYIEIITNQDKAFEKVSLRPMPGYFNSRNSDYGAIIDPDRKYVYFTSLRPSRYEKENIWRAEIFNSGFGKPQLVTEFASDSNEAIGSFSQDGKGAYLFGNYEKGKLDGDIYYSQMDASGRWEKPEPLDWLNSPQIDAHASVYGDSLIFFTSARPGGEGETDIWVSVKENQIWQDPINLGPAINTPGKEQTPQLVHFTKNIEYEGRKMQYKETALYFASDGHPGFGGSDIFKAIHKGPTWQDWYLPQNLGLPVNSIRDDRYFSINPGSNEALISSDRAASGFEKVMLAYVEFTVPGYYVVEDTTGTRIYEPNIPPEEPAKETEIADASDGTQTSTPGDMTDTGEPGTGEPEVTEPEIIVPEPRFITFTGKVTDENDDPIATDITFRGFVNGEIHKDVASTDADGNFTITLPYADPWTVVINPEGYMLYQQDIPGPKEGEDEVQINFTIQSLAPKKVFVFNNIQFNFDSAVLRKESYPILDDIVITMHNNPEIRIEISGHTCSIGDADYNQGLSERRAQSVVNYLIKKDVDKDRLSYQGFGETKPLNDNKTKAKRALNRRVEIKVLD